MMTSHCNRNCFSQTFKRSLQQTIDMLIDMTNLECVTAVTIVAIKQDTAIHRYDIAFLKHVMLRRNAMYNDIVDRRTD